MDSGANYSTISVSDLTPEELDTRRKMDHPIPLKAATESIWVDECAYIWADEFVLRVKAVPNYIEECRCVVSLGRFVDEAG